LPREHKRSLSSIGRSLVNIFELVERWVVVDVWVRDSTRQVINGPHSQVITVRVSVQHIDHEFAARNWQENIPKPYPVRGCRFTGFSHNLGKVWKPCKRQIQIQIQIASSVSGRFTVPSTPGTWWAQGIHSRLYLNGRSRENDSHSEFLAPMLESCEHMMDGDSLIKCIHTWLQMLLWSVLCHEEHKSRRS